MYPAVNPYYGGGTPYDQPKRGCGPCFLVLIIVLIGAAVFFFTGMGDSIIGGSSDNSEGSNAAADIIGGSGTFECSKLGSVTTGHWDCDSNDKSCFYYVANNCYTDADWSDFSTKLEKNFSLGELALNQSARLPNADSVIPYAGYSPASDIVTVPYKMIRANLLAITHECQLIRDAWSAENGGGLKITSGFRPYTAYQNQATFSRHKNGDAVDIAPGSGSIYTFQSWLDERWNSALGYGAASGFVHIDLREGTGFCSSATCQDGTRWNY